MKSALILTAAAALALTVAPAAFAQSAAPAQEGAVRVERVDTNDQMRRGRASNPNDRVCRAITATGSRLGARRVCRTRAEWEDLARDSREGTDGVVRQNLSGTTIAGTSGG